MDPRGGPRLDGVMNGATDWTRTSTAFLPIGPKPIASTNFATVASHTEILSAFYHPKEDHEDHKKRNGL